MPKPSDITLPRDLVPTDGRFGSGPSKVDPAAVDALAATGTHYMGTSHRKPEVRAVVGDIRTGLAELYDLPPGYEVVMGVGGATAFWDAAVFGLIRRRSQHLTFGEFSSKFAAVAAGAPHLDAPQIIASEPGTHPRAAARGDIDLYALTHNETSTGVAMPVTRPAAAEGAAADGIVAVDATSAAGAMVVDTAAYDVYYFSPQKAFGSDGGLWVALCSPAAVSRIDDLATSERWIPPFLDLGIALANSRKDQTYNTPALATLFLLRHQIERMLDLGGLTWSADRCRRSSTTLYEWAEASDFASPFVADPGMRSTTVVTIDFVDEVPVDPVEEALRANGIRDVSGYRKLGRNQLRIACFPNIDPDDIERLTGAIDHVVAQLA